MLDTISESIIKLGQRVCEIWGYRVQNAMTLKVLLSLVQSTLDTRGSYLHQARFTYEYNHPDERVEQMEDSAHDHFS